MPIISLHLSVTTDSVSHLYIACTCVQAEHAVDHGHGISAFQPGLLCIMPRCAVDRVRIYTAKIYLYFLNIFLF